MTPDNSIQSLFFEQVRKMLPSNVSLADELAEILNISRDSAYRRLRGETVLSLDEVKKLSGRFRISVDSILSPSASDLALFSYRAIDRERFTFFEWLKTVHENLSMLRKFPNAELWFFAKDIPIFYYFNSPLLSAFKMYFWMSAVLRYDGFRNKKFHPSRIPVEISDLGQRVYDHYTSIRRTEIWSEETLNVTLRQIEFYHECGLLEDPSHAVQLCDEYSLLLSNIHSWAEIGYKDRKESSLDLYKNDLLIADNTILFKMGEKRIVFIPYNTLSILSTTNPVFCSQTEEYLVNVTGKSEKISTTGEKQRHSFFNQMNEKIRLMRKKLS